MMLLEYKKFRSLYKIERQNRVARGRVAVGIRGVELLWLLL